LAEEESRGGAVGGGVEDEGGRYKEPSFPFATQTNLQPTPEINRNKVAPLPPQNDDTVGGIGKGKNRKSRKNTGRAVEEIAGTTLIGQNFPRKRIKYFGLFEAKASV